MAKDHWTRVLEHVRALPGTRVASLSTLTPMSGRDTGELLGGPAVEGRPVPDRSVRVNHVSEDYLAVFGIRLLQGRAFTAADRTAHVAVINQTTQADVFGSRSAVGELLQFGRGRRYRIVGVVQDAVATHQAPMSLAGKIGHQVRQIE